VHELSDASGLVKLYGYNKHDAVISSRNTVECADTVGRMIVNTYLAPEKTLPELHDRVNRGVMMCCRPSAKLPVKNFIDWECES